MSVKLDDEVVEAIKAHYGPYYCDHEPVSACQYGPGPITNDLDVVYNCGIGSYGSKHNYNGEKSIHIAKNWLYHLEEHLQKAKKDSINEVCANLFHYRGSIPIGAQNARREGVAFIFNNYSKKSNEYLATNCRLSLTMKWEVGKGKGFLLETSRIYVNGKLVRTNPFNMFSATYVTKRDKEGECTIGLEFLSTYEEPINEIKLEVDGQLDTTSSLFPIELLDSRIRPFYKVLQEEAERYFSDHITLDECMLNLRNRYLALPSYQ